MKRLSPREYDYAFGAIMLTLRSAVGLTQAGLAAILGVSRRSVSDWESGSSYPKAEHLKQFIKLAVEQRAFHVGREDEEIRALWKVSHQKVLLDEVWLSALLTPQPTIERSRVADTPISLPSRTRVDWGDALSVPTFYGREWELNLLTEWVVDQRCRVISVLGLGGIGKSALVVTLMRQLTEQFEVIVWHSLRDAPTLEMLLEKCLNVITAEAISHMPDSLEERLNLLLSYLRKQRILLVLDNLETLLEEGEGSGRMRAGYEAYERLLQRLAESEHQSCVLLTSREKPEVLSAQEGSRSPVRAVRLSRLDVGACEQLLAEKDISGSSLERRQLVEAYTGNPLAIKIVMQTIVDLFDGEIGLFLEQGEVIYGGVRELLNQQFMRLSSLEQSVLLWLAILREPAALDELLAVLVIPVPKARLLEAVESLFRRSLIERGQRRGSFTLQSVVLEYATARIVAEVSDELQTGKLIRLVEQGLELAYVPEYVRQTQERLLLLPVLSQLRGGYSKFVNLEGLLIEHLGQVRTLVEAVQGYAPANLIALLRILRGHLRELDLSHLLLRSVYLQGVDMQDTTLSEATILDSIFTETFDVITAVAVSSIGGYWATASRGGEVQVWTADGMTLLQRWRAHSDMIWTLAFSPDGRTLASGSWDSTVKLWDIASGALLWSENHTSHVNKVTFDPSGTLLASSSEDETVQIWDLRNKTRLEVLVHPCPVAMAIWSPNGRFFASGDLEGSIRLWEMQMAGPSIYRQTIAAHTSCVDGLDFSPDSNTLASVSWDSTVKLWEMPNGSLRQTLTGHTDKAVRVAWSPDGLTLVSSSLDQTVRLWDVEQGSYRAVLRGHTARVNGLAFTPDSCILLSGGEDGTLRVWDNISGQCTHVIQGYAAALYDVDWSPDGTHLVSSSTDYLVTIYDVTGENTRVLRGHTGVVFGVGWSSSNRWLVSSEMDNAIRLWDAISGVCVQVLRHPDDPDNYFYGLAWSPDGQRLACGTYRRGVHVFNMTDGHPQWVGRDFPTWIRHVAWSPDGSLLAGGGDDGTIYVWDATSGVMLQQLVGHHSMITRVAWSPDGRRLASGSSSAEGGELFVWDMQRGQREYAFVGLTGIVYSVAWGWDCDLLISGSSDGRLRWWDLQSGKCIRVHKAHEGTVQSVRRSPDGTTVASCGDDGAIGIRDIQTGALLKTLRRDRPYERLDITGIQGLTEAQMTNLRALGAIENYLG